MFDTAAFKNVADTVEKVYGDKIRKNISLVKNTYDLQKQGVKADRAYQIAQLEYQQKTGLEDIAKAEKQTAEDVTTTKERQARNFNQAMGDTQLALAARSLTYGGTRMKEEAKIRQENADRLADLERRTQRTLEDLQTTQARLKEETGMKTQQTESQSSLRLKQLEAEREKAVKDAEENRQVLEAEERKRIRDLG